LHERGLILEYVLKENASKIYFKRKELTNQEMLAISKECFETTIMLKHG